MKAFDSHSKQKGVALVLSLLILLVLTVVGVAAMNSTVMQERMAGNAGTQADVFETSSEGVTRSLELFYQNAESFQSADGNQLACGQVFGDTNDSGSFDDESAEAWSFPVDGSWHLPPTDDANPKLGQKMYCCRSWEEVATESGAIWVESPSKLFALNRATFMGGVDSSQSLSLREIEVELAEAEPDDPTCAICVPGDIINVDGANSKQFTVNGSCGAAIVTDSDADRDEFYDGIPDNRIGNYTGGIVSDDLGEPWNSAALLAEFVFWIKLGLHPGTDHDDAGIGDSNMRSLYIDIAGEFDGGNNTYGTPANPQITYIDGDARFGGNAKGHGILITRGKLSWNGTPDFDGLIISLGDFDSSGSGNGEPDGSMVFTDVNFDDPLYPDDPLYRREVLHYQVAMDDDPDAEQVKMYHPPGSPECDGNPHDDVAGVVCGGDIPGGSDLLSYKESGKHLVPERPILLGDASLLGLPNPQLIYYYDADEPLLEDRPKFFLAEDYREHSQGDELVAEPDDTGSFKNFNIEVEVDPGVVHTIPLLEQPDSNGDGIPDYATRDAYGRMIPEFVLVDNYPDDYGYNPNHWSWDRATAETKFSWGEAEITWDGGGNSTISYDCRMLQQVRQELLCQQPLQSLPSDPHDDFYENPEEHYGDYCWHSNAGVDFTDEDGTNNSGDDGNYFYETTGKPAIGPPENQKAWHMWNPSCDCLGISVNADMVIAGWRENLGWRDAEDFQGCDALPSPAG